MNNTTYRGEPMELTQWGQAAGIWIRLDPIRNQDYHSSLGNFTFDLSELHHIYDRGSQTKLFFDVLNSYCYVSPKDNPFGFSLDKLYRRDASVTVTFDPFSTTNLYWNNLTDTRTRDDEYGLRDRLFEQSQIRIHLLANADCQRALANRLRELQEGYSADHQTAFPERIAKLWDAAREICLPQNSPDYSTSPDVLYTERWALYSIFLLNKDFRREYLSKVYTYVEKEQKIRQHLNNLDSLLNTITQTLPDPGQSVPATAAQAKVVESVIKLRNIHDLINNGITSGMLEAWPCEGYKTAIEKLSKQLLQLTQLMSIAAFKFTSKTTSPDQNQESQIGFTSHLTKEIDNTRTLVKSVQRKLNSIQKNAEPPKNTRSTRKTKSN